PLGRRRGPDHSQGPGGLSPGARRSHCGPASRRRIGEADPAVRGGSFDGVTAAAVPPSRRRCEPVCPTLRKGSFRQAPRARDGGEGRALISQPSEETTGRKFLDSAAMYPARGAGCNQKARKKEAPPGGHFTGRSGTMPVRGQTYACASVIRPTMAARTMLCQITALKMSASLPTWYVAAVATQMLWASIILPMTPPVLLAVQMSTWACV